ncbi:apolipoprotein N-acyltransferase [Sneathiella sp. P13V-1]|uniref:apolipoprotein N-acyltransferase n=1 Tax=Sneathiella sp. P13V-1 TaxID=2697366 RepID=UPI00187BA9CE|nr:apolipoprotein N-acyltransferase [Sneathiella sp. P13V-1]MBE7635857.1 apolipoprotein N-acyltransferase [Sneathiella sp. P13V-1]
MQNWLTERPFWQVSLLSFLLGSLLAATFAPVHLIFLLPLCYSGLLVLLARAKTAKQAFFIGWWFGFGQFVLGLYWIGVAFTIDANAHAALIPVPTLLLPACLAIFNGLATYIIYKSRTSGIARILLFTAVWTSLEYVRGLLFTGFPWNLAGYSWGGMLAMLQWTAYLGIYGLTLLTILISSMPALLADNTLSHQQRRRYILLDCALLIVLVGAGFWRLQAPALDMMANTEIRVVQPNNPQKDKWKGDTRFQHLRKLMDISQSEGGQNRHWIWPETALPFFMTTDDRLQNYLAPRLPVDKTVITGAPRRHPTERKYWNSVQALGSDGSIQGVYDKRHLLPYGEYLPIREFFKQSGIASLIPVLDNMSDFSFPEQDMAKTTNYGNLPPARTLICYEVAFPWEVSAPDPFDWILNVTNDAWFGNTSGPHQHFVISRTRAIEQGVSMIRSANNGISAIIDGYGRILQKRSPTDAGLLDSSIPAPIEGRTVYAKYGESIPITLTFLVFLFSSLLTKRRMTTTLNPSKQ